ncbi:MAG: hypothetical protein E8D41_12895 [Nitrospira sp.]|nr:MAG: hypothetical protein E8D41_12895 [Nitrospira sp.]
MATRTSEKILSYSAAVTPREQKAASKDVDHRLTGVLPTAPSLGQRCEARVDSRHLCSYEMIEAIEEFVVIEQGKAITLNRSPEGMLLFMRQAPHVMQMIEVRTPRSRWGRTMNVFDIRWVRPVQVELFGHLYLVGCRRMFGPCHYLSF